MLRHLLSLCKPGLWRAAAWLHHVDFALLLPGLARLPLAWGYRLAALRGQFNALTGRDWRSMALGMRHIRRQSLAGYALLPLAADDAQRLAWRNERFVVEARDEFEARLVAAGRVDELACRPIGSALKFTGVLPQRERGLLLLTPHFDSFFVGVAFVARGGARVNLMSSAVTHDPRVDVAVQRHFSAKYRGLEPWLNGGQVLDMEQGVRPFYRMLERGETLVVLGDAPVLPNGVAAQADFLGARRLLAGGALRLAEKTGSDIGGYVCCMERPGHYVMEWCEPGPAGDPQTVQRVYDLFSRAILTAPGRWWGSDLLPNLPVAPTTPDLPASAVTTPVDYSVLLIHDSPLAGTDELAFGLQTLQRQWPGSVSHPANWILFKPQQAPTPAALLKEISTCYLLVLLDPALLGTASLPQDLADCLDADGALCALADEARFAVGEWAPTYSTQVDFDRFVARRAILPRCAPHGGRGQATPKVYMLRVDRLASMPLPLLEQTSWTDLPERLGAGTFLAPRAFVHSYADYQQGTRAEMLELLPRNVKRLLDVGGGEGGFAQAFVLQRGGEAVLVEPGPVAAQRARDSGLQVIEAGIESPAVAEHVAQQGRFDAVSFLDVLEHLNDPLAALRRARQLLTPGGTLLVSVPNVGYWPVVRDLLAGRFDYLPVGILCNTHVRFFTAYSLEQLLQEAGFELVQLRRHAPAMDAEFMRFVQAAEAAGTTCDQVNLATESLHALARAH